MAPLLLAITGLGALGVAAWILRGFGPRYRVGRLLAVVPPIPVAEAVRLAQDGERRYVRVDGRIDSEAEFEDADHRPLVLRRTTFEWRPATGDGAWRPAGEPGLELAPFVIREGLDELAVDAAALGEGLVVVPRHAVGRVADLGERAPAGVSGEAEARMVVEQVSSVEHASVLGVPVRAADGSVTMSAGMGRPLVLTTLERDEAMRVLTGGAVGRSRTAIACLAGGVALLLVAVAWWVVETLIGPGVSTALGASPDPTLLPGTDIRPGGSPGFIGEPGLAVLGVAAIAVASVAATAAWVRVTGGRRRRADERSDGGARPQRR